MKIHFNRGRYKSPPAGAFTLIEVLLAEVIFLILLALMLQFIFVIMQTAQEQKKSMDSLGESRQSLDRLNLDWAARVRRPDVPGIFTKLTGNDTFGFPTQVQAYNGTRHLAWVFYQVGPISQVTGESQVNSTSALERGIVGYNWASNDPSPDNNPLLSFPFTTGPALAPTDFEPLANSAFRLEFSFLQQVSPNSATTSAFTVNSSLNLNSPSLVGIVVAIAALDQQSRQILTQQQLTLLANALPDAVEGQDPRSLWQTSINNGSFVSTVVAEGIPRSVAGSVRVFQRILYVKE